MRWLIQENLNSKRNYLDLLNVLHKLKVEFLILNIDKKNNISVLNQENMLFEDESENIITSFTEKNNIMVYGSKALADIAKNKGYKPGSFLTDNFEFSVLREKLGNHLLNENFVIGDLFSLNPTWNNFFIRPTGNTKLFTGMSVSKEEFEEWKCRESININSPYIGQSLMISELKEIMAEYRFFIINKKIISHSSYMVNSIFNTEIFASAEVISYAEHMVEIFTPSDAFVMDIAVTNQGYKIVEFNNINSSGFYNCDIESIVKAINQLDATKYL